jgi:hypothetical protein
MAGFLELTHNRQHEQHRFDDHAVVPFVALAQLHILRIVGFEVAVLHASRTT